MGVRMALTSRHRCTYTAMVVRDWGGAILFGGWGPQANGRQKFCFLALVLYDVRPRRRQL